MISTPPSEPVAWACVDTTRNGCPIYVASRTWFDARAFAATQFAISPAEVRCDLFTLEAARDDLLATLRWRAHLVRIGEAA